MKDEGPEVHPAFAYLYPVYHQHILSNNCNWNDVLIRRRHAAGLDGIWHSSREWLCCICGIDNNKRVTFEEYESDAWVSDDSDDYESDG